MLDLARETHLNTAYPVDIRSIFSNPSLLVVGLEGPETVHDS